jgi:NAD(P) transhydrogenase subunit alpha
LRVGFVRDTADSEQRIAITPTIAAKYARQGIEVAVEKNVGIHLGFADESFRDAGAAVAGRTDVLSTSDVVGRVAAPPCDDVPAMKKDSLQISFFEPSVDKTIIEQLCARGVNVVSLNLVPRTTYAQKMDALSSQANLAGYVAAILGATRSTRIMPMMTTPAGTIRPMNVFVIGAGVCGLQAIATAERLGARVTAFDTRPVVAEQVRSLGARFLEIDIKSEQNENGYALEMTAEKVHAQQEAMADMCAQSDVIITAAQVFGRKAPVLITSSMLQRMKRGTVVVDTAMDSGGNVEGAVANKETEIDGVMVVGYRNLASRVAVDASEMFASNVLSMVLEIYSRDTRGLKLDVRNEIVNSCLVILDGKTRGALAAASGT